MSVASRWVGRSIAVGLAVCTLLVAAEIAQSGAKGLPKTILIIRHAEKPEKDSGDVHLSKAGKERADQLYQLFIKSNKRPDPFPTPEFIFATHEGESSHRPVETVTPLAQRLKLAINEEYHNTLEAVVKKKQVHKGIKNLRDDIFGNAKFAGKTILICWHHGTIPELAHALKASKAPDKWDGSEMFDRVWQITYSDKGEATFVDRPQQLMPGDAQK